MLWWICWYLPFKEASVKRISNHFFCITNPSCYCLPSISLHRWSGDQFNIKMSSYSYIISHYKDKMVSESFHLNNGNAYTGPRSQSSWSQHGAHLRGTPQMGPMLVPWTLLSGVCWCFYIESGHSRNVLMWFLPHVVSSYILPIPSLLWLKTSLSLATGTQGMPHYINIDSHADFLGSPTQHGCVSHRCSDSIEM